MSAVRLSYFRPVAEDNINTDEQASNKDPHDSKVQAQSPQETGQNVSKHTDSRFPGPETSTEERFTWPMFRRGVLSFFQLEKGLLLTLRDLIIRPGYMLRSYLFTSKRNDYTNPIGFIFLSSALVAFAMFRFVNFSDVLFEKQRNNKESAPSSLQVAGEQFGRGLSNTFSQNKKTDSTSEAIELVAISDSLTGDTAAAVRSDSLTSASDSTAAAKKAMRAEAFTKQYQALYSELMAKYYNVLIILGIPLMGWWTWMFFRQDRFHFSEHMVVNAYLLGVQNFLFLPLAPFVFRFPTLSLIYLAVSFGYSTWVYYRVFSGPKGMRVTRSALSTFFGLASYSISLGVIIAGVTMAIVFRNMG